MKPEHVLLKPSGPEKVNVANGQFTHAVVGKSARVVVALFTTWTEAYAFVNQVAGPAYEVREVAE